MRAFPSDAVLRAPRVVGVALAMGIGLASVLVRRSGAVDGHPDALLLLAVVAAWWAGHVAKRDILPVWEGEDVTSGTTRTVEQSARESAEEDFRTVHDASPDSFILLDVIADADGEMADARIRYANDAACRLMHRPEGSLAGRILNEAFPQARESGRYVLYAEVYRTGRTHEMTFYHDVVGKWLRILIVKVGKGFCIISADVSALKAAEHVLRSSHDELEQRVAERTAELVIASEAAQAASVAKSEFLSRASHELRTPLNAVIGFSTVLLKNRAGTLAVNERKYLDRIQRNGRHLLALVNDLLDLSKIEAGKLEFERAPFSVCALVRDVHSTLEGRAADAGLHLVVEFPEIKGMGREVLLVNDEQRLRQVLINLVGNAIKYTERGGVTVRVTTAADRSPERIDIVDSGIGISPSEIDSMFEPFVIGEHSASTGEATGLGLAISRSLCQAMGYRLSASSTPGAGSTFSIQLAPDSSVGLPAGTSHVVAAVEAA